MNKYRYVAWVFVPALIGLLAAPWLLPHETWAALLEQGFNWPKGVVLLAFAGMAAVYAYWLVQFVRWVRTLSFNTHRDARYTSLLAVNASVHRVHPNTRHRAEEGGQ